MGGRFLAGLRLYLAYPGWNYGGQEPLRHGCRHPARDARNHTAHPYGLSIFSEEPLVRAMMARRFYEE